MLNIGYGGELVRRAAANVTSTVTNTVSTVSSTVSTVASVASGGRRRSTEGKGPSSLLSNAKDKFVLSLKCTPNKDANTCSNLAIKSGFLMKKNEQGVYQRRYICIVPHMFLYYFENEHSETPRGVVDLELFDTVLREPDNVIKLTTAEEENFRSFYFQDDDTENLTEWLTGLLRDRYHAVLDERNAYQQMQFEMTGAIDAQSSLRKTSEQKREQLEQEREKFKHDFQDAFTYIQVALVELGITDEEMGALNGDVNRTGVALKARIIELKNIFREKLDQAGRRFEAELQDHSDALNGLKAQLENEEMARRNLEALRLKERREFELKLQDADLQVANINVNLQMAIASKEDVEIRASTLQDQKKLLVKEVRHMRKRLDETQSLLDEMKAMNAKLVENAELMKKELEEQQERMLTQRESSVTGGDVTPTTESDRESSHSSHFAKTTTVEKLFADNQSLLSRLSTESQQRSNGLADDEDENGRKTPPRPTPEAIHIDKFTADHHTAAFGSHSRRSSVATDDGNDDRSSWDMPPVALRELGWLTEHQSKLLEKRIADRPEVLEHATPVPTQPPQNRRSSLSILSGVTKAVFGDSSVDATPTSSTPAPVPKRSSLISSVFGSATKETPAPTTPVASASSSLTGSTETSSSSVTSSSAGFFASPFHDDETGRLPVTMRLTCLRCKGSVEGPKFSTCKCAVPAMSPDDLATPASSTTSSALTALTGMFSKGSSVAGGIAGGFVKATSHSVEGLIHYTNNPMSASSSHGTNNSASTFSSSGGPATASSEKPSLLLREVTTQEAGSPVATHLASSDILPSLFVDSPDDADAQQVIDTAHKEPALTDSTEPSPVPLAAAIVEASMVENSTPLLNVDEEDSTTL